MEKKEKPYVTFPWFDLQIHKGGPNIELIGIGSHSHLFAEDDYYTLRHVIYFTLLGVSIGFGLMRYYNQ